MAIYHLRAQVIRRSAGRSAVAASAYRSGGKLVHEGTEFDYGAKGGVDFVEVLAPPDAPGWMLERQSLWTSVEEVERRSDAQLAREIVVALPVELGRDDRIAAARKMAGVLVDEGMVVDLAVHHLESHNPHAHLLCSMRRVQGKAWGNKERSWNTRGFLQRIRTAWRKVCAFFGVTVDERSYAEQGVKKLATVHVGVKSTTRARRGRQSREEEINAAVGLTRGVVDEDRWVHIDRVAPAAPSALDRYRRLERLGVPSGRQIQAWTQLAARSEKPVSEKPSGHRSGEKPSPGSR